MLGAKGPKPEGVRGMGSEGPPWWWMEGGGGGAAGGEVKTFRLEVVVMVGIFRGPCVGGA